MDLGNSSPETGRISLARTISGRHAGAFALMLLLLLIVVVLAITLAGTVIARRTGRAEGLIALHVIFSAISQILASKLALFDLGFARVTATAATIIFPVTFLITDIVNEKFGRRTTQSMVFLTFLTQMAMAVFLWVSIRMLPPAPGWDLQAAWESVFGLVPRIMLASWITFLVSENLDAWLFDACRRWTGGRHLWARNAFSTIPALTVDTVLFVGLAFGGTGAPLGAIMEGQFITKYVVALLSIPLMYANRACLGPVPEFRNN